MTTTLFSLLVVVVESCLVCVCVASSRSRSRSRSCNCRHRPSPSMRTGVEITSTALPYLVLVRVLVLVRYDPFQLVVNLDLRYWYFTIHTEDKIWYRMTIKGWGAVCYILTRRSFNWTETETRE